jgi:hypothetical protein
MAKDKNFESDLEKGRKALQRGKTKKARKAVHQATLADVPEAFFIAGMSYLAEEDYMLAEGLIRIAESKGFAEATNAIEMVKILSIAQFADNRQALKVQAEAESLLSDQRVMEGSTPLRPNWWVNWYPKSDTKAEALLAVEAYLIELHWQIDHAAIAIAKNHNLSHWNDLCLKYGGELKVAHLMRSDQSLAQRALGSRGVNRYLEMVIPHQELAEAYRRELPDTNPLKFIATTLPDFVDLFFDINPAAAPRIMTLIPYLMMPNALSLSDLLEEDAKHYFSSLIPASDDSDTNKRVKMVPKGVTARRKIAESKLLDLEGFERVGNYFDFCPQMFPTETHVHFNGEWPRRGWKIDSEGTRESGCTPYFINGQWKCLKIKMPPIAIKKVAAPPRASGSSQEQTTGPRRRVAKKAHSGTGTKPKRQDELRTKNLLIELSNQGKLPFKLPAEPWSDVEYKIGPVLALISCTSTGISFRFDLGRYEDTQFASAICEEMSGRIPAPGPTLSYSLQPQPQITLKVEVAIPEGQGERIVEFALAQTADLAIDLFRVGIASEYLLDPTQDQIIKFGLMPNSPKYSGTSASRHWADEIAGTKILFNL